MTDEELLKRAQECTALDGGTWRDISLALLAQGYIDSRAENAALSVKLEAAEQRIGELEEDVQRRSKQYNELHETLEEAEKERDKAREDLKLFTEPWGRRDETLASRGEVVTPQQSVASPRYAQDLCDAMNEERWKDATYLLIAKVDSLYRERGEVVTACPQCGWKP